MTTVAPDIDSLPFEAALAELDQIVTRIERGNATLDESIALYERGQKLKRRCETLLAAAEAKVEVITRGADGAVTGTRPLDAN
jgi:exodeoxyribonuclease VII small subunit